MRYNQVQNFENEIKRGLAFDIRRAASVLDRVCPGWAKRINLNILDMNSKSKCVLGQVFYKTSRWFKPWTWFKTFEFGYVIGMQVLNEKGYGDIVRKGCFTLKGYEAYWKKEILDRTTKNV